jgi:hypothetical protein
MCREKLQRSVSQRALKQEKSLHLKWSFEIVTELSQADSNQSFLSSRKDS